MTIDTIFLAEPERVDYFYPFSIMHPVWEIRCGALRLFEKIKMEFPDSRIIFSGRELQLNSFLARFDVEKQNILKENVLVLSSSVIPTKTLWDEMKRRNSEFQKENGQEKSVLFVCGSRTVAAYIPKNEFINPTEFDKGFLPYILTNFGDVFPKIELEKADFLNFLWQTIELNADLIIDDYRFFDNNIDFRELKANGVFLVNENSIKIGANTKIGPGAVLDASKGPIIIGENVRIYPCSTIIGPCFIGDNSLIKIGAKIYEKTSIGEWCKVGGEVENSIIQSYSNKQHDGFLGHSYLGEWINLGADTNTSDLKNTYADIKIHIINRSIDTKRMFLGLLCGDHTKSGINTMFNTGTVCGICSNIFGAGYPPNYIPSFFWGGTGSTTRFKLESAIEIAKTVMLRRNKVLLSEEETLIREEFSKVDEEYHS